MNSVPLADALPWRNSVPEGGRTILVGDSVRTDGTFVLHVLASSSNNNNNNSTMSSSSSSSSSTASTTTAILWLSCTSSSNRQIAMSLKKVGCDAATAYLKQSPPSNPASSTTTPATSASCRPLHIIPMLLQISDRLNASHANDDDDDDDDGHAKLDGLDYLKTVYQKVRSELLLLSESPSYEHAMIVLDDVSNLASILGEQVVYAFIHQLRSMIKSMTKMTSSNKRPEDEGRDTHPKKNLNMCLLMKCSFDAGQEYSLGGFEEEESDGRNSSSGTPNNANMWVGSGGDQINVVAESQSSRHGRPHRPWENSLVELADGIIDVVPLQSGFSKEAHGRLIFSERKGGQGWQDVNHNDLDLGPRRPTAASSLSGFSTSVINYACTDTAIKAIRLRTSK